MNACPQCGANLRDATGFLFCPICGNRLASDGATTPRSLHPKAPAVGDGRPSDAAIQVVSVLVGLVQGTESPTTRSGREFLQLLRPLTDADWESLHQAMKELAAFTADNLDLAEDVEKVLQSAADCFSVSQFDADPTDLSVYARLLGLKSAIPFPPYGGDDTWTNVINAWLEELRFVAEFRDANLPLTIEDAGFMSDLARSHCGPDAIAVALMQGQSLEPTVEAGLSLLERLRITLPPSGYVLDSMTAVTLLLLPRWEPQLRVIAEGIDAALREAGVLLNPRRIHLVYDSANVIEPWWREMQGWNRVIERWKQLADWELQIGVTDVLLADALKRSLDWSAYADPAEAALYRQDEEMFAELRAFLGRGTS